MVLSIVVLLMSVIFSAVVLHFRRKKLQATVDLATVENPGAAVHVKGRDIMDLLDLEYDDEMPKMAHSSNGDDMDEGDMDEDDMDEDGVRALTFTKKRRAELFSPEGTDTDAALAVIPATASEKASKAGESEHISTTTTALTLVPMDGSLMTCGQCGDSAPGENGSVDDADGGWYCNTCWRLQEEDANDGGAYV
mmetsp:Transcript_15993/g.47378  ORF Transcript_15993/g.47378 Transcript_15993/m.47378 type:complete len:194 (+) Transcript_15993:822-1403(+)